MNCEVLFFVTAFERYNHIAYNASIGLYSSVIFSIFTVLCNHLHEQFSAFVLPQQEPPTPWQALPSSLLLVLNNRRMPSVCVDLLLWTFLRKEVRQYMAFCAWLL